MIFTAVLTVVLASLVISVLGQDDTQGPIKYDVAHNVTTIYGTWSSGSKNVVTGSVCCMPATPSLFIEPVHFPKGFANPANMTFIYPKTTGISYSLCVNFPQSQKWKLVDLFYLARLMGTTRSRGIDSTAMVCLLAFSLLRWLIIPRVRGNRLRTYVYHRCDCMGAWNVQTERQRVHHDGCFR